MHHHLFTIVLLISLGTWGMAVDADVSAAGKTVATLHLPTGWTCSQSAGKTVLITPTQTPHIQIWVIDGATDVAKAAAQVATLITSEVTDFRPITTKDLVIAGVPAKQMAGPGIEADDGDPGNAEVIVFQAGHQVMLCVSHGEGDIPVALSKAVADILAHATIAP